MTNPMELTPAGRDISQAEQDRWLKGAHKPNGFDPRAPITGLAFLLVRYSNGLSPNGPVPWWWGGSFAPIGLSKHANFCFYWGK